MGNHINQESGKLSMVKNGLLIELIMDGSTRAIISGLVAAMLKHPELFDAIERAYLTALIEKEVIQ